MRGPRLPSGTSTPLRAALLGAAAAAVLTACGGGSGTTSAAGSSSPPPPPSTSSAPSSSAAGGVAADSDFCTQARSFATEAGQAVAGGANSPDVAQQLQALVGRLGSIDPPPDIAADWQSAVSSLQQLAQAYQGVDLRDPQQVAQLQQRVAPLVQQLSTSGEKVDSYLQTECGISIGDTSESASASS